MIIPTWIKGLLTASRRHLTPRWTARYDEHLYAPLVVRPLEERCVLDATLPAFPFTDVVDVNDDVTLDGATQFSLDFDGTAQYGQLRVSGSNRTVNLNDTPLDINLNFTPADIDTFTIVLSKYLGVEGP
jgi:hypothetical protein